MNRGCIETGCPLIARPGRSRCAEHERQRNAERNRRRTGYAGGWDTEARRTVQAWTAQHGYWCPGIQPEQLPPEHRSRATSGHPSTDLTCDHRKDGSRGVLCRACNGLLGKLAPVHPHR